MRAKAEAENSGHVIDASPPEPPESPEGAADEGPSRPEEQENYRVAAAEDEDDKLKEEPGADKSYGSRIPEMGNGLAGRGETVKGAELCSNEGRDGEETAGIEGVREGEFRDKEGLGAHNVGEGAQEALEVSGKSQGQAQSTDDCGVGV
ncbi:hypothetical protein TCAP_03277 [Tolypocladium capitatum]|uniref:Uncharacterized protein n=1 Tax=Tolypocladium capitatum TaxID=45235 RepID=A0A2K3QGX2_9HYPO|nr:hypothetical protein TCAP_03277 [Tolypocladium capitatum]